MGISRAPLQTWAAARQIPHSAGENAEFRDDALQERVLRKIKKPGVSVSLGRTFRLRSELALSLPKGQAREGARPHMVQAGS
jgi:hypothetical protein